MAKVRTAKKKHATRKAGLKSMWKTAKKQLEEQPDIFGIEVPDGPYIGVLTGAETKVSAEDWNYVDFNFTIQEGEQEDQLLSKRDGLETEENIVWLMRDLARLGVEVDDLEIDDKDELDAMLTELVGVAPKVRLVAKTNDKGYQNVFINKLLEVGEPSGDGSDVFEKGDRVEVEIDGTNYLGEITSLGDDKAKIAFDDGDKGTHDLSELTKLEEPSGDSDIEDWIGEQVGYREGKTMYAGKVIKVDASDNTFVMKTDTGKKITGDIGDLEKPEAGEATWSKGDRVQTEIDGTTYAGEIQEIKDNEATVEFDDGDVLQVALDELGAEGGQEPSDDDQTAELEIGTSVEVEYKGKDVTGTVKKINEEDEEVTVFLTKLKKKVVVPVDKVAIVI